MKSGLIHSGQSTVSAFGTSSEDIKWPLSIRDPDNPDNILKKIELIRGALSGSGLKKGQHIIDPRSGKPISNRQAAWVYATNAAEADALSTAFMVMTPDEIQSYCERYMISGLTIDDPPDHTYHYYGQWKTNQDELSKTHF